MNSSSMAHIKDVNIRDFYTPTSKFQERLQKNRRERHRLVVT